MRCVLWTGSRGWQDVDTLTTFVESLAKPFRSIVGDAKGLDLLIWEVLADFGLPRMRFHADWQSLGRVAGFMRNEEMCRFLQAHDPEGFVAAGWDGKSKGTKHMIDFAEARGISVWRIPYYENLNRG